MKSKYRLNISNGNLVSELRSAASVKYTPGFEDLVHKKERKISYRKFLTVITRWNDNILGILVK